jgi:hypothetical protein
MNSGMVILWIGGFIMGYAIHALMSGAPLFP